MPRPDAQPMLLGTAFAVTKSTWGKASNSVVASHTILFVTNLGDVPQNLAKVHSTLDLGETAVFVELCLPIFCPIPSILGFSGTLVSATEHPGHSFSTSYTKRSSMLLVEIPHQFSDNASQKLQSTLHLERTSRS